MNHLGINHTAQIQAMKPISHGLVLTLSWLFAILYGVWLLPETVFIRHFCLVTGAILSLYVIYPNRKLLLKREAAPIWLIFLLMLWVTFHLFFIGKDFQEQWEEYTRIWKKVAVGAVFAMGLGLALISQMNNRRHTDQYWRIIYLGFLLPTIVYFVKFGVTSLGSKYGFPVPLYLVLDPDHIGNRFGISRSLYVFFCLPAFAIALGKIVWLIRENRFSFCESYPYLVVLPLTITLFLLEADRFGMVHATIFMVFGIGIIFWRHAKNLSWSKWVALLMVVSVSLGLVALSVSKNAQWKTLIADAMVSAQVDRYDHWKNRNKGYPVNEYGQTPTDSNYSRLAWAIVGSRLLIDNPLGYGLMSLSFRSLGKEKWPDSDLSWTHSAWLDFGLGYGIPGLLLLASAAVLAWRNARTIDHPWRAIGQWALPIACLVMITKEVSTEAVINALIFLIIFISALRLPYPNRISK